MSKNRVWQFGIATWFWIVVVVATFFLGRNWDNSWGPLWRRASARVSGSGPHSIPPGLTVTIPAMGPAPVVVDVAQPMQNTPAADEATFTFFVGFTR